MYETAKLRIGYNYLTNYGGGGRGLELIEGLLKVLLK